MNGQGNSWRNLVPGMVLVALGLLFLADKFYYINFFWHFRTWWPLLLIGFGVLGLLNHPRRPVGPIVLITVGVIFQVDRLDFFPWWSMHQMWPVILIVIGVAMMLRRFQSSFRGTPPPADGPPNLDGSGPGPGPSNFTRIEVRS